MLRMMFGIGRRRTIHIDQSDKDGTSSSSAPTAGNDVVEEAQSDILENWVDWIKRATSIVDNHMVQLQIDSWCVAWRRKVWRYAGRVAAMPADRWAQKAATWCAADDPRSRGRQHRRPKMRWADEIVQFLRHADHDVDITNWMEMAKDASFWGGLEDEFCFHAG